MDYVQLNIERKLSVVRWVEVLERHEAVHLQEGGGRFPEQDDVSLR